MKKTVTRPPEDDAPRVSGSSPPERVQTPAFPIVAIGASAGGLEALRRLFGHLPVDSGLAFVVIQHLDPDRRSMLVHVIERITPLPVAEAAHGMRLEPNRVHVIPSGADLTIRAGVVALVPREKTGNLHLPIDTFFRSLAEDARGSAIGVVLSGSGADGREGLRTIKAEGGIAIAQDPESAQFRSMPESAIAAGVVDFTGSPEGIAEELVRLSRHPYLSASGAGEGAAPGDDDRDHLAAIFALLRRQAGVDFGGYKRTTILRRIDRRIALRRAHSLEEYGRMLHDDPTEARALAADMLIHVTSFFRDPDAFTALKELVFRPLVARKADGDAIRIWVPGCSTGEEAYAVTMCLMESLEESARNCPVKVFGSDLSDQAIQTARRGVYSESAVADVLPARLDRFFERFDGEYRIAKEVRDLCLFAKHDLTRDPPFARLDLISCRNVLIYFDAELQGRIIPTLHHCLNEHGYLFLGQSETINSFRELFQAVDKEYRIFAKTGDSPRLVYPHPVGREAEMKLAQRTGGLERPRPAREAQRQADHLLLARYAPPAVIVNEQLDIVQYRGRTGGYLESPPGEPQANVLRMAREGLGAHLHEAIERAKAQSAAVRKEGLRINAGARTTEVSLEVVPLASIAGSTERYFLVLFEEAARDDGRLPAASVPSTEAERAAGDAGEAARLHAELLATQDYLQSLISEHYTTTDELATANEELIAGNEELQSTNEELQSAKEELQSTNEELTTVNDQLESRNEQLDRVANDLTNVLASVEIPVIIVDLDLRVRRFTPSVREIARFIPQDVGRPLDDLKLKIDVDDLAGRIRAVIGGLAPGEWEVRGPDDRWFRMAIRPYRTADNRLDGAVLSFVDVNDLKRALGDAERARDYARSIVETVSAALVVIDAGARVVSANDAFYDRFGLSQTAVGGKRLFDLGADLWQRPVVYDALDGMLGGGKAFAGLELATDSPSGRAVLFLSGRPILWGGGEPHFLLAIEDVTVLRALEAERVRLLEAEKQARLEAERANRAKDLFLATLSHELRTPLSAMLMSAHVLKQTASEDPRVQRASASIERSARSQARLIGDLLDVSRIVSGKLFLDLGPVDLAAAVREAVDAARPSADAKALELTLDIDRGIGSVYGDAGRLQQVVSNLLGNAIKFTPHGGRVSVALERVDRRARLTVRDTGIGIRPDVLPNLFNRFVQADSAVTRTHGGLGLGLSIVRHLVEVHGGTVQAESPGEGQGATFCVTLPLGSAKVTRTAAAATVTRGIEGVRVLLVEDDADTREAYVTMLGDLGAVVRGEASAADAMAALEEFSPQVILSDAAMPGEDGFGFIERVRRRGPEQGGQVPAAAITALASDEHRQRALEAGFQMHVAKPIDAARLAAVVSLLANWRPSRRESAPE
ncbi:MAG TPA: chemotaxis protein CheB [Vicinamibacterales bacterium]|nr:chemotaxis protein CheB [Vicinamibacterales bacterium]